MKKGLIKLVLIVFISGLFLLPKPIFATASTVVINEVLANCLTGEEDFNEFIELYNYGMTSTDVAQYQFTDGDSLDQVRVWTTSIGTLKDPDVIINTTIIPAKKYAVILDREYASANQPYDFPAGTIILTSQHQHLGNGLTEDDPITLYNSLTAGLATICDTFGTPLQYDGFSDRDDDKLDEIPFDPGEGKSLERTFPDQPDSESNWTVCGDGPSPGADNNDSPQAIATFDKGAGKTPLTVHFSALDSVDLEKQSLSYQWLFEDGTENTTAETDHTFTMIGINYINLTVSDGTFRNSENIEINVLPDPPFTIRLNEVFPKPKEDDETNEFIELYNSGNDPFDLMGFKLDDGEGGSGPYIFSEGTVIDADQYLVIYRPESKLTLNNDTDEVRLFDPEGNLREGIGYTDCKEGLSYNFSENDWKWSTTVTPNEENEITGEVLGGKDEYQKTTIAAAKKLTDKTKVVIEGIVTVEPNVFSDDYLYFQDGKAGLKVYYSKADFPKLKVGDKLKVQGEMSTAYHERKLNIELKSDITIIGTGKIDPEVIKTNEIGNENRTGQLVTVQGKVDRNAGTLFYLNDGSGSGKVSIKETTGIKKPETKKGKSFRVTGIINKTTSGNRLLPRYQGDITDHLVGAGMNTKVYVAILAWLFGLLICLTIVLALKK